MFKAWLKWLYEINWSDWDYPYDNLQVADDITETMRRVDYWCKKMKGSDRCITISINQ